MSKMIELREPLEALLGPRPRPPFSTPTRSERLRVYDTTLRDGEQAPGVAFSPEQKYELAALLSEAGIDILDIGFPSATQSERRSLEMILKGRQSGRIRPDVELVVTCRANEGDIDVAVQSIRAAGADPSQVTLFIFTSASDLHLKYKIGKMLMRRDQRDADRWLETPVTFFRDANIRLLRAMISYALSCGVGTIEFGGEDGSRADVDYLVQLAAAGYDAGGHRFAFPDTVGTLTPEGVEYYISRLVQAFPTKPLLVHFHNDFGLAAINSVRALQQGATIVACTVNGIGERAGNAPLHTTLLILKQLYGVVLPNFRYDHLRSLSRKVEDFTATPIGATEPIVGHNVFRHETGTHVAGLLAHPAMYEAIDPSSVGATRQFVFGKHSGEASIEALLRQHSAELANAGISVTPELVTSVTRVVKDLGEHQDAASRQSAIQSYYTNLGRLGVPEDEVIRQAVASGRGGSP